MLACDAASVKPARRLAGTCCEAIFRNAPASRDTPDPDLPMIDAAGGPFAIVLRFIALTAATGTLGAWVFARLVVARMPSDTDGPHREQLQGLAVRVAVWSAAVLAVVAIPRLIVQAAALPTPDGSLTWAALTTLRSSWGRALVVQGVAAAVAAIVLRYDPRTRPWHPLADVAVVTLAGAAPFLAHAGSAPVLRAVSMVVDFVHGTAAGAWVGALALLAAAVVTSRRVPEGPTRSAALIAAFHPVALVAAATVFTTGLATAWLRMGAPEGIASSTYSGLFVAKLLLAGVVGAYGAGHSKLATRRLRAGEPRTVDPRTVSRTLMAECLVAVLVLVVTAVLVGTAPIG